MNELPEQELSVKIANVDGIHVNDMNGFESHQRQILQEFTSEAAGSDD